jgi:predicted metal-dependent enzyme (double-stranded beta helix superfamily)
MAIHAWIVNEEGTCEVCELSEQYEPERDYYRLYHFLYDLEVILKQEQDARCRLQQIFPLVRRLLMSSYWLQTTLREPDPEVGWSLLRFYDEPFFPLTIQSSVWLPGKASPIHNHATWGVVALISGQEKNTFWRRVCNSTQENVVEQVGEYVLHPGDLIGFLPDAIHQIETVGAQPAITFNLYGETSAEVTYFNALNASEF